MRFTTVIGLDEKYLNAFGKVWPNWSRHRSEIAANPIVFVCDSEAGSSEDWYDVVGGIVGDEVEFRIEPWTMSGVSQREKMLTGLFVVPTYAVNTDWFLKLDCDSVAMRGGEWISDEWFEDNPAFIASPWGYTKPGRFIRQCEEWSGGKAWLSGLPPVVKEIDNPDSRLKHRRVISYVYFGNTVWHRWAWGLVAMDGGEGRLPCPSHDTYASWLAEKTGSFYRRVRMKSHGWGHSKRLKIDLNGDVEHE